MKKRGLASPDDGDGLVLTFAHPVSELPRHAGTLASWESGPHPTMLHDDWVPFE